MRKCIIYSLVLIVLSFLLGMLVYNDVPDNMASHWNAEGKVDGHMSKLWGLFLIPLLLVFMFLLFLVLPVLDPLRKNIDEFRNYYDLFIAALLSFMFYLYLLTLLWNLGYVFNMGSALIPGFAFFFFYMGLILQKSKRNWFLGIRNPWTLSSDFVWNKTHAFGGLMFKIGSLIMLPGLLIPKFSVFFVLVPVLVIIILTTVYSFMVFKEAKKIKPSLKLNKIKKK